MSHRRILPPLVVIAMLATLTGCLPLPFPQRPPASSSPSPAPTHDVTRIDVSAAEDLMMTAMPTVDDPSFLVDEQYGLADATFGSDWSKVDHDAARYARSFRSFESAGWSDTSVGPAFWVDFEVVLMKSESAAGSALTEVALAAKDPYTVTSDDGSAETTYAPMDPSGRWPFGTVEQTRSVVWSSGARASGWAIYYPVGPFVAVVYSAATPDDASQQAMNAFADAHFPAFIAAVQGLPAQLDRL